MNAQVMNPPASHNGGFSPSPSSSPMSAMAELQRILRTPPPTLEVMYHGNPMAVAHSALEALRDAGDPQFLFLRTILEWQTQKATATSPTPLSSGAAASASVPLLDREHEELLFHCITGCRQVFLWHWVKYSSTFLTFIRDYFMVLGHELESRTCRMACYSTAVSFWKRGWNQFTSSLSVASDANDMTSTTAASFEWTASALPQQELRPDEHALLLSVQSSNLSVPYLSGKRDLSDYLDRIFHPSGHMLTKAAQFLDALVGEFSGKSAVSYRLPLEFHKTAHRSFERDGSLDHALQLAMQALHQVITSTTTTHPDQLDTAKMQAVVQVTSNILGWEFGLAAWDSGSLGASSAGRTLLRPPAAWKEYLARDDLPRALFQVHEMVAPMHAESAHSLRQLLLQLASLSGAIFTQPEDRQSFCSSLVQGSVKLLERSSHHLVEDTSDFLDILQLIARIIGNFRLTTLVNIPELSPLLHGLTTVGVRLLTDQVKECETAGGDVDAMEHGEWREEAIAFLLEAAVLLCGDPWLLYSGTEESRMQSRASLSAVLGPLYEAFARCRTRLASMDEYFMVTTESDLDEVKEDILEIQLGEELTSVATLGRLNLASAVACLSSMFGSTMPQLQSLWSGSGEVTAGAAALLEESRLLTMYVGHLLTDNNEGETPTIPETVVVACLDTPSLTGQLSSAVQILFRFAEAQVQKIAEDPSNHRLSPLLAKTFLWFLNRFVPAYVHPSDYGPSHAQSPILVEWAAAGKAQQTVSFCVSLCLQYQCLWPNEMQVQNAAGRLLLSLAKRCSQIRSIMVNSPGFHQLVQLHCWTALLPHGVSREEMESSLAAKVGNVSPSTMHMARGYQRLPYADKARILTAILVACSDGGEPADSMTNASLKVIHESFTSLIQGLESGQLRPDDASPREVASICVGMLCGVTHASEMPDSERIPQLLTPYLPQLSSLMAFYAHDLDICESLLCFFRDYAEHFIAVLDREQSMALFRSAAELLKRYSADHIQARVIVARKSSSEADAEEEQVYGDILCAIQLLMNLGAKDFIDICSSPTDLKSGVDSSEVTDMIFFGLQQILPLMTQGLLQYPTLCSQFFELVGFMADTYPDKLCLLPFDLMQALLEALLVGMRHYDASVANHSLHGMASLAKEHLATGALQPHLQRQPDLLDLCLRRLLTEVVFQSLVVDRVEAAGMALLPLAAVNRSALSGLVQGLTQQVADPRQQVRLQAAFAQLLQPDILGKVSASGYEGRMNRAQFKRLFEEFVSDVHSFLVMR